MANLYFIGGDEFNSWEVLSNWNTASDGTGDNPTSVPWVDGYYDYDLLPGGSYSGGAVIIQSNISASATGTCSLSISLATGATINAGTFSGVIYGQGGSTINGGTFTANNSEIFEGAIINGGTFSGNNFSNLFSSTINGGTFSGTGFTNGEGSVITGGTFNIDGFTNNGTIEYSAISVTMSGSPYTGAWGGTYYIAGAATTLNSSGTGAWDGDYYIGGELTTLNTSGTGTWDGQKYLNGLLVPVKLYYTNANNDGLWETLSNWNTESDDSGVSPSEVPWSETNGTTNNCLLVDATSGAGVSINTNISVNNGNITGTCAIPNITNNATIYKGRFISSNFTNNGSLIGGSFNKDGFVNGVTGVVRYNKISINNNGAPFTGSWQSKSWEDGWLVYTKSVLYFTGAVNASWADLGNWNTAADGSGSAPTEIPWTETDGSTDDTDLIFTNVTSGTMIECYSLTISPNNNVRGRCYFGNGVNISFSGTTIKSGTFVGPNTEAFVDGGTITGATFSLLSFTGTFTTLSGNYFYVKTFIKDTGMVINSGTFAAQSWPMGQPTPSENIKIVTALYYKNTNGNRMWNTLANWNTAIDGTGTVPTEAPWSGTNSTTSEYHLIDATLGVGIIIESTLTPTGTGSKICNISDITNNGNINAGNWNIAGMINNGTINYSNITANINTLVFNGVFQSRLWKSGLVFTSPTITLYYTNASGDNEWGNVENWNSAEDGSGDMPSEVPWGSEDWSTSAATLLAANGNSAIIISLPFIIGNYISSSKTCDITDIIVDGTTIKGGNFLGSGLQNSGELEGGKFNINGLVNTGAIDYEQIMITFNGINYTGVWEGYAWKNGVYQFVFIDGPFYFTNSTQDGLWTTLANWNNMPDGSGSNVGSIPWTEMFTSAIDLYLADGITTAPKLNGASIGIGNPSFIITADCDVLIAQEIINNSWGLINEL